MVSENAQLYTIEGVAAAILMVVTAYLVISTNIVLTPQDTHIPDMQLEQLGHDALLVMNTPEESDGVSHLAKYIHDDDIGSVTSFRSEFSKLIESRVFENNEPLNYEVRIYYLDDDTGGVKESKPAFIDDNNYHREDAVKITQLVLVGPDATRGELSNEIVLVEVLLWRS